MVYLKNLPLHMVESPPFSVEVAGCSPVPGESIPRRHPLAKDGLLRYPLGAEEVRTVFDLVDRSARKWPDKPAVGWRRLIRAHKEMKTVTKLVDGEPTEVTKEWTLLELSPFEFMSYAEYRTLTLQLGSGLRGLGLETGDRVHVFASTSARWLAMSHAISTQSLTLVTAYDTLGEAGVEHSLVQTSARAVFVDPHLLKTIERPLTRATSVRWVIYNDASLTPVPGSEVDRFKAAHPGLTVLSFSELRARGEGEPLEPVPPKPEDVFCIMYTSGSTGKPKGVPVSHACFVAAVAGVHAGVAESVDHREVVLSYLPLAHIFELVVENLVLLIGATQGYGTARTLADSGVRGCGGDMRELAPTVMVGVPQVWETVRKGVQSRVASSAPPVRLAFAFALAVKSFLVDWNLPGQSAFDGLVFGQVRAMTGGRLRFIFNGATGISEGAARFMSLVVAPMIQGYGLTETCGNGAIGNPLQWTSSSIGAPPPSIEVKLVSIPELGYEAVGSTPPQGEILIRGNAVAGPYYDDPEETAKAVTADGWFRTGDIGEWDANGHLRIIDRVKNLVKLQGGEYVALEKLEAVYRGSHAVHSIMVHGDSANPRPIAIIHPNEKVLHEMAAKVGVTREYEVHHSPKVWDAVLKDLVRVGKKAGLSGLEIISGVVLVEEEWTPVNGLVTATQKVNRRPIKEKYKKEIAACFGSN